MTRNSLMLHTMAIALLVDIGSDATSASRWWIAGALLIATVAMCVWFETRLKRAGAVFT